MVGGDEFFALKFADVVHDVFVHGFVAEKDFDAAGFETFEVGTVFEGFAVGADKVIDFLLRGVAFASDAREIVGEGGGFAFFGKRGFEAEEFYEGVLVGVVHRGAFLEEDAKFFVKLVVGVGAGSGFFVEEFEEAFGNDFAEFVQEGFVLHGLARDVEREVFAIDNAFEEAEPVGEQVLGFGVDEDFAAVEGDGGFEARHAKFFRVLLGDEEEELIWSGASALKWRRRRGSSQAWAWNL